jgi:transcriptional regulator with PAS, ATPase and Fis domain
MQRVRIRERVNTSGKFARVVSWHPTCSGGGGTTHMHTIDTSHVSSRHTLIGSSSAMQAVLEEIETAAKSDAKVLITGETGVGKEAVAHAIHQQSRRCATPFVAINCAGVPDTLLESEFFGHVRGSFTGAVQDSPGLLRQAHKGTLFMDEVGEMSLRMQALLLRFLESGEVHAVGGGAVHKHTDVRVIAATNRDLPESVDRRQFREDLYYRLNVLQLRIPPLRDRRSDIPQLMDHYLRLFSAQHEIPRPAVTPAALDVLVRYRWPGNIRELRNAVERLVLRASDRPIDEADLPREIATGGHTEPEQPKKNEPDPFQPHRERLQAIIDTLLLKHESFWTSVYAPFMLRDLTRDDVRFIVRLGLERTRGSYRTMVTLFNMNEMDYKRFMGFLKQHDCHLPFRQFRTPTAPVTDGPEQAPLPYCHSRGQP